MRAQFASVVQNWKVNGAVQKVPLRLVRHWHGDGQQLPTQHWPAAPAAVVQAPPLAGAQTCWAVQVWQAGQLPLQAPPQPSLVPHAVSVQSGVQPQTFGAPGLPPPHVCPLGQPPHWSWPPQPSAMEPQFLPSLAQVVFVQPH
jgi:hypothetical protein